MLLQRVGLVVVLAGVCGMVQAQMGPSLVVLAPVESRAHLERQQPLVASVEPVTRTVQAAQEPGLISERLFDEGQRVKAGDVLVRTDIQLLQAQRTAAEAGRQAAIASLARAEAQAENARRELDRIQQLREERVATEKESKDAVTVLKVAEATVAQLAAEVEQRAAEVQRLDLVIRKSEVRSAISGVVARRHVEVGQWIDRGAPVADVVQLDPLFVRVGVPEAVVSGIAPGGEAKVTIDALGGRTFVGKVEQILPEAEAGSRTVTVKILLPNPQLEIRPGFFARAELPFFSSQNSFLVPGDAVVLRGQSAHVIVNRGGKAAVVPVELGPSEGSRRVVRGELQAGEQVVIRGNENLRGGEDLMVVPGAEAGAGAMR